MVYVAMVTQTGVPNHVTDYMHWAVTALKGQFYGSEVRVLSPPPSTW